jgi:hypothetical protein
MNPARRSFLSTSALIAPVAAIAGCSLLTPANVATVQSVISKIQAVMPYISGIASVVGAVVPGASAVIATVNAGLTAASNVFNTMASTMTAAAAQPLVSQIATYIGGSLTAAKQAVTALPATAQATVNNLLAEADSVIADLNSFVNPAAASAIPGLPTVPVHLFIRAGA